MDVAWPGSTQDARIWNRSEVTRVVEETKNYYIAGDIGYLPLSLMSENVYGRWTKKFPRYQKTKARMRLESSQKIIVVSAIISYDYGVKRITRRVKVMITT